MNAGTGSLTVHRNWTIRVVTTYLPLDDLTEIVVYVRPPGGEEEVVPTSPDFTHNHQEAESMGHTIGRFWIDER